MRRADATAGDLGHARQAEVHDLHRAVLEQDQVLRLHVAVDDVLRVGRGEPVGRLARHAQRVHHVEALLAVEEIQDLLAVEQLHHEVVELPLRAHVVDLQDVLVVDLRDRAGLGLELLDELRVGRGAREQDLDRDRGAEGLVRGPVDARRAALPDQRLDAAAPDDLAEQRVPAGRLAAAPAAATA